MVDQYPGRLCSAISPFRLFTEKKNRNLNMVEGRIHKLYGTWRGPNCYGELFRCLNVIRDGSTQSRLTPCNGKASSRICTAYGEQCYPSATGACWDDGVRHHNFQPLPWPAEPERPEYWEEVFESHQQRTEPVASTRYSCPTWETAHPFLQHQWPGLLWQFLRSDSFLFGTNHECWCSHFQACFL